MTTLSPDRQLQSTADPVVGWSTLLVVLAGTFMTFLDFFIVNVALPSIQTELHAGPAAIQLVVAGYGLTFAVGMITGGRLGDLRGRRRMFSLGLLLFTLTSAACGLAPTAAALIVARVLQGAAGALMTPQVLAILGTVYAGERRAKAFAAYGLTMGLAGVLGQIVGGALIHADIAGSGWRGIFLINVPVGFAALLAVRRHVPESFGARTGLDVIGAALVTAAVTAVVLPLVEGRQYGWPLWSWVCFAAAPLLGVVFVVQQRARRSADRAPLVEASLFADRSFTVGNLAVFTFALVPPAFFFVLALYLQEGRGFSPLFSGIVFAAVGVGFFAALLSAEPMAARMGRQVLAGGAIVVAVGCLLLALTARTHSSVALLPGLAVVGFGIGMVLVPVSSIALQQVALEHSGSAAGVLATSQQVGGAVGIAVVGVVFYDALGMHAFTHAFVVSLLVIAALTLATAALVQALPRPHPKPRAGQVSR